MRVLRIGLSFILQLRVDAIDTIADWMESRVFQAFRLFLTAGVVWLFFRGTNVHSEGGGLSLGEFAHYGRAATITAVVAACMSILWSGSFCDGLAGILMHFIDDPDDRPLEEDPMEKLNRLARTGHVRRARRLCKRMLRRKEGSRAPA